ncbi:DUF4142 domain-containing protein [Flavobacterium sp. PLA-1-15]|uniref:DUF4142 domain-containing protein n=1 Tax=Flavobacterium sp. PLA-1-15 TaxID=3380533 RepID=UPI003B764304
MKKVNILGKTLLSATLLSLCIGTTSCKQEPKAEDPKEAAEDINETKFEENDAKEDDSQYLVDAAETDLKEIEIGKLAQQKGTDAEVKAFGKKLVDDHTKSWNELKAVAEQKQITLPAAITEEGQDDYNKLNEKTGHDFDKKFAEMMVDGHKKALDKAQKASEKANDAEIRTWAAAKIVSLTAHRDHAQMLKDKLDKKK